MTDRSEAERVALKPCPFCGGEARSGEYWPTWDTREANVWCYMECGASVVRKTEPEAIAAWNTRAILQENTDAQ
jgi:Lar family restriction alleviation protein